MSQNALYFGSGIDFHEIMTDEESQAWERVKSKKSKEKETSFEENPTMIKKANKNSSPKDGGHNLGTVNWDAIGNNSHENRRMAFQVEYDTKLYKHNYVDRTFNNSEEPLRVVITKLSTKFNTLEKMANEIKRVKHNLEFLIYEYIPNGCIIVAVGMKKNSSLRGQKTASMGLFRHTAFHQ